MSKQKETPEQIAAKRKGSICDAAAMLGMFSSAVDFAQWLQENHLLPEGTDVFELAESYAIRFSSDRTKAAFQTLINH